MGQSRESSLIFSLKDLEALEQDRVRPERAETEAKLRAERFAEAERLEKARADERRRLEADERSRQTDERLRREESARLDALGRAAVERARAEVEARVSAELARARERHELALEATRASGARGRQRWMLGATGTALVVVGGLAADLSLHLRRVQNLDDEHLALLSRERGACARLRDALTSAERTRDDVERRIAAGRVQEAQAAAAPADVHAAPVAPKPSGPSARGHRPVEPSPRASHCTGDGDPLNGCLPRP